MTAFAIESKRIYHEYLFDNQPQAYSFQSETGQFYLAKLVDHIAQTDTDIYIDVQVSKTELDDFENNKLTFKQLYDKVKNRTSIIENIGDELATMTTKLVADLPADYLKKTDEYFNN